MNTTAVIAKIDRVLSKYAPVDRTVYKRVYTSTGGDALIGRPGASSFVDTLLTPQPLFTRLTRYPVGPTAKGELEVTAGAAKVANSYSCMFSVSALPLSDLQNPNLFIAFKDSSGATELFRITDYEPTGTQGTDLMYTAYIQTTARS